jgi:hypothetical protein
VPTPAITVRSKTVTRKPAAILFVLSLAVLALAAVPAAGLAAKGGNGASPGGNGGGGKPSGGGGTISLVLLDSTDGVPHFGQRVTFEVSTTSTTRPFVTLKCYQGGAFVYQASNGMFPSSLNQVFTLGPTPSWRGGDADCTAYLENWDSYSKNGKIQTLASTSFHVYA